MPCTSNDTKCNPLVHATALLAHYGEANTAITAEYLPLTLLVTVSV